MGFLDFFSALKAACTTNESIFSISWNGLGGDESRSSNIFAIWFEFKWEYIASMYSRLEVRLLLWRPLDGAGASGDVELPNNVCVSRSRNMPR